MSAYYRVLTNVDLLRHICDFHTDNIRYIITKHCNQHLSRKLLNKDPLFMRKLHKFLQHYDHIHIALGCGNMEAIKLLYDTKDNDYGRVIEWAIEKDRLDIIIWLHQKNAHGFSKHDIARAALHNKIHIIKWLHKNRKEGCTTKAMDLAVEFGYMDIVLWLHRKRTEGCTTDAMDNAAAFGNIWMVKWLHENRQEGCTTQAMDWAAQNGHLHVVKWLHKNRTEGCTTDAMDNAAKNGNLHVLEWLNIHRWEGCTVKALQAAINHQHLYIAMWLIRHCSGCTLDTALNICKRTEQYGMAKLLWKHFYPLKAQEPCNTI